MTDVVESGKGFNDSELADIMSEIESLEEDFRPETKAEVKSNEGQKATEDKSEASKASMVVEQDQIAKELKLTDEVGLTSENATQKVIDEGILDVKEGASAKEEPLFPADRVDAEKKATPPEPGPSLVETPPASEVPPAKVDLAPPHEPKGPAEKKTNDPLQQAGANSQDTQLEFNVAGDMKLNLKFVVKGNVIHVRIDEEKCLRIELPGGINFSLPLE